MRTFCFRNRDPLTVVTPHRVASASAGADPRMAAACVQGSGEDDSRSLGKADVMNDPEGNEFDIN